mmetsp:Transcript_19444/g.21733  ORF Transcript_19444/g.21733 Transcript_19444/m.21733 type:complete len:208 (+) Transcript_19444:701-1324(+)
MSGNKYGKVDKSLSVPEGLPSLSILARASAKTAASFSFLASFLAFDATIFSSRIMDSRVFRNLSTDTNSSRWSAPSPLVSNSSMSLFTRLSSNSAFRIFSSPFFNSSNEISPSSSISNLRKARSVASATSCALLASNDAASARNLAAIDRNLSTSLLPSVLSSLSDKNNSVLNASISFFVNDNDDLLLRLFIPLLLIDRLVFLSNAD